jgi:hypothetical protein
MTATRSKSKNNAGRRGAEFEKAMLEYRKWFTTGNTRTQFRNANKLKHYCEWIGKSPQQLIDEYAEARKDVNTYNVWKRDARTKILEFYNYLKSQGYEINTARTQPLGILAFYSAHCETVKDVTKNFDAVQIPENEYAFSQEDLRQVFYYADTEGKALISLAVSLGYSAIDFLELEAQKLKDLIAEAKDKHLDIIGFIGKTRAKTSVQPRSFLTPEAIDSVSEYLTAIERKQGKTPKYLWCNHQLDKHITNQGLNKKLKTLLEKANVKTYGKQVKFHGLRKFLYSRLQAKNRDIAKVITAKKVSASDITYIPNLDAECERIFRETYREICLNGDVTGKTRKTQEEIIEKQNKRIEELETFNRYLTQAYGEDIVQKALKRMNKGEITKPEFEDIKQRFEQWKKVLPVRE